MKVNSLFSPMQAKSIKVTLGDYDIQDEEESDTLVTWSKDVKTHPGMIGHQKKIRYITSNSSIQVEENKNLKINRFVLDNC